MRTHSEIVRAFGPSKLRTALVRVGFELGRSAPGQWIDRNSIPQKYWRALSDLNIARLDELAAAADARAGEAA